MANGYPLTTEDLAALIVDALVDARFVERTYFDRAVAIAAIEIDVRKAMGDYSDTAGGAEPTNRGPDRAG